LLLSKLAVLAPNTERGLSLQTALGSLQRNELILAVFEASFCGVVSLYIDEHFGSFLHSCSVPRRKHLRGSSPLLYWLWVARAEAVPFPFVEKARFFQSAGCETADFPKIVLPSARLLVLN
jgi:hypothetical protein